ncbi:hypothetical protein PsYK624_105230 [Phanerochaete sordida]|uniref:F-box domain-containing protein n=1 Tax=Phanerochaete sordida TaxID=48140 RepID=A0A9P3GIS7_9APHY|nr:hypothetical protein PsYK624_105230 [Phanerochaete sordida]
MTSLDPLYQTLPNGVWTKDADGDLVVGTNAPTIGDWARFTVYASRIRELSFAYDTSALRPALLKLVMRLLPSLPRPPPPRLQALRIAHGYTEMEITLCLTALVHPKLRVLDIVWPSPEVGASMLSIMQLSCPSIRALVLGKANGLLPMVARFTQLQKLVCDDPDTTLDMRTLMVLARLPHLRHLSITSEFTSSSFTKTTEENIDNFFPSLKEIIFENVTGVLAVADFLCVIKLRSLRSLSLKYTLSGKPKKEMRALVYSIALHADLIALSLCSQEPASEEITEREVLGLGTLTHLRKVYLTDVLSCATRECFSKPLLLSWAKVQSIHFDCALWRQGNRGVIPALGFLETIIKDCPQLTDLRIALATIQIPRPRNANDRARERRFNPLRLTVPLPSSTFDSQLDPYDLAEYLSDICPGIEIVCEGGRNIQYPHARDKWAEVNRWIARLNAVRDAERRRIEQ